MRHGLLIALVSTTLCLSTIATAADVSISHGTSLLGRMKYGPDFTHLDYINPDAPKGGTVRLSTTGNFDTLNGFVIKGDSAPGLGLIYNNLMASTADEPSSINYGLLAKSIERPADNSWAIFNLRPEARWHDGKPLTVDDVIFSFNILREKGQPFYRHYYKDIGEPEKLGPHKIKFPILDPGNRELAHILAQFTILPKHYWEGRDFNATTLEPPLGSGPYRIEEVDAGRSITYKRVEDYWAKDLPLMVGRYNFDRIRFDVYRDTVVAFQAFKSHNFDFRVENVAKNWATGYDVPAVRDGRLIKEERPDPSDIRMQAYIFNLRRPLFADRRVREALSYTFDFEWANKTLFYGQYKRITSYFNNSELAAEGLPSEAELRYLEPLRDQLPPELFTKPFTLPKTDASGRDRRLLRAAKKLLQEAGWVIKNGILTHQESGQEMRFEFLYFNEAQEKIVAHMKQNMKRLGVELSLRRVDSSQYIRRLDTYDFDMIVRVVGQALSPGNEQRAYWGSASADQEGGANQIGIKDPAVDQLIEDVISAPDRDSLVAATRALDRTLLWGYYVIPHFYTPIYRLAYWDRFGQPAKRPEWGLGFLDSWWIDSDKEVALESKKSTGKE